MREPVQTGIAIQFTELSQNPGGHTHFSKVESHILGDVQKSWGRTHKLLINSKPAGQWHFLLMLSQICPP